jgi:hypothetical protein
MTVTSTIKVDGSDVERALDNVRELRRGVRGATLADTQRGREARGRAQERIGFGDLDATQGRAAALGIAGGEVLLEVLRRVSNGASFREIFQDVISSAFDSIPIVGKVRQIVREEQAKENERFAARLADEEAQADLRARLAKEPALARRAARIASEQLDQDADFQERRRRIRGRQFR